MATSNAEEDKVGRCHGAPSGNLGGGRALVLRHHLETATLGDEHGTRRVVVAYRHPNPDHPDRVAAGRAARMKRAPAKTRKPSRERQEGWDERLMVRFALVLAAACAALAVYETVTWAAG